MKGRARLIVPIVVVAIAAVWLVLRQRRSDDELAASGTVEATEADLGFQVPGRIASIAAEEGAKVAAGAELAALDAAELRAARDAAAAQLEAARARLLELERGARPQEIEQAEAVLRGAREREQEARREAERAERLFAGGAVSRSARDQAVTALEVATAARQQADQAAALVDAGPRAETVAAQRAQVELATAHVDGAEAALAGTIIAAPFTGQITVRHRQPGEIVPAGAPVLTLLDPADRWVRIYVAEDRIGRVAIGQAAVVTADSWPDRSYEGRVVQIGSEAEFTPRNVQTPEERTRLVYPVKVRITGDPSFDLKPGIPADVRLAGGG